MDTKQVKKVVKKELKSAQKKGNAIVNKNLQVAKVKSVELKAIAKSSYDQFKKDMNISSSEAKKLELKAIKEYEKLKKQMENTTKKVETYMKKNPAKASLISAGIGAALAGAATLMLLHSDSGKKGGKKKK